MTVVTLEYLVVDVVAIECLVAVLVVAIGYLVTVTTLECLVAAVSVGCLVSIECLVSVGCLVTGDT